MAIGVSRTPAGYEIVARTCPTQACSLAGARPLANQPGGDATATGSRFHVLDIGGGRHVVHVETGSGSSHWQAIVAAPIGGNDPIVVWSGLTPEVASGGTNTVNTIQITPGSKKGTVQVLVGESSPRFALCGRPALLTPRIVYPQDLSLRHVKLQRLGASERDAAETLTITRTETSTAPLGELLVALGASSAHGSPGALTDGNPNTVWSERRGKEGRGEFVVMKAPSEVPITSFSFVIRPPETTVEHGASPKSFFLAADGRLMRVDLPEDAWKQPGARYEARLTKPLSTSCLGLVLDDAYLPANAKDARVTVAELTAYSSFDGNETYETLAGMLSGSDTNRANAAAAVLLRGGKPAFDAVASKVGSLNASGRHLAMNVLDAAPCSVSSPVFAAMLASDEEQERAHAQDRIRRCGRRSAEALSEVIEHGAGCAPSYQDATRCQRTKAHKKPYHLDPGRLAAANELASVAPERVVPLLAPLLGKNNRPTRQELRRFVARAAAKPAGRRALAKALTDETLPVAATVDLLRAAEDQMEELHAPAVAAFARLAQKAKLRTRYLLIKPAAALAGIGDDRGLNFLLLAIASDSEPMVRTQAVIAAQGLPAARPWVMRALEDPNVRVRRAAATSLASEHEATPYLVRRLLIDDWPMVRAASARSLASTKASALADRALLNALADLSPKVRQWAATALGARGAHAAAPALREMADNGREKVTVRIAAVHALGVLCDSESLELLTIFAQRSADPYSPEAASGLGAAAVASLGRIHPPDLKARLQPLLEGKGVPAHIKSAAVEALASTKGCKR